MNRLPKFCDAREAAALTAALAEEFAVVVNPAYVHPPYELYPLAPKARLPLARLTAVVCDMDGTTTTTEPLCLHSLEHMVRRMTARPRRSQWPGLSPERDYPHVIGNSTTRHVEHLLEAYADAVRPEAFWSGFAQATLWTLTQGRDPARRDEARTAIRRLGWEALLERAARLREAPALDTATIQAAADVALRGFDGRGGLPERQELVRGAIEIYYARYHQILQALERGECPPRDAGEESSIDASGPLIEPMPGAALFLAVVKGLIPADEAAVLYDALAPELLTVEHGRFRTRKVDAASLAAGREAWVAAAARFARAPLRTAIVTSSIAFEARIVLGEVFRVIRRQIDGWPLTGERRAQLCEAFDAPEHFYDAILTATDSSEIRLKPHRDLYSMALHRLGLAPDAFGTVLGLEDSESGVIAMRAAGIGAAVAVPFAQTRGHCLDAAARILHGGLPELMFRERFFWA